MHYAMLFFLSTSVTLAHEKEIPMENDGFVLITTHSFSNGQVCRKLDTLRSLQPIAWHLKPAWNSVYLGNAAESPEDTSQKSQSCQTAIIQRTLVGPLKKGSWKLYGPKSVKLEKTVTYSQQRELKRNGEAYAFTIEKPAILSAEAGRFGNTSGRCREFVPLRLSIAESGKTLEIRAELGENPQPPREGGICRAMPQTSARAAIEIAPGSYRMDNKDIKRVTLFLSP